MRTNLLLLDNTTLFSSTPKTLVLPPHQRCTIVTKQVHLVLFHVCFMTELRHPPADIRGMPLLTTVTLCINSQAGKEGLNIGCRRCVSPRSHVAGGGVAPRAPLVRYQRRCILPLHQRCRTGEELRKERKKVKQITVRSMETAETR